MDVENSMALPRLLKTPFRTQPPDTAGEFDQWLDTEAGNALLRAEYALLADILPRATGYTALQCSVGKPRNMLSTCRIRQQVLMSATYADGASVQAKPCTFPLRKQSLDLIVLHHSLDFDDHPHQILRNAVRGLVPGGALVVVGFNPSSVWGLLRWFRAGSEEMPWRARFLSAQRMGDWLSLLGCEPEGLESRFHSPPKNIFGYWLAWLGDRLWSQHGSFYVMVARKRAAMMRPARSRFALSDRGPNVIPVPVAHWRGKSQETLE